MRVIELICVIASLATSAAAAPDPVVSKPADETDFQSKYSRAYMHCSGFRTGVTQSMLSCIARENHIQGERLNVAFAETLRASSPSRQSNLRTAQHAWLTYRDEWCGINYETQGSQGAHVASAECILHETIRQTIKLEALARDAAID